MGFNSAAGYGGNVKSEYEEEPAVSKDAPVGQPKNTDRKDAAKRRLKGLTDAKNKQQSDITSYRKTQGY